MPATKYTYSIANDFPQAKVDSDRLSKEVSEDNSLLIGLQRVDTAGDVCDIWFKDALSGAEQTALGALVAAHSGDPLPSPTTKNGVPVVHLDGPVNERDNKPIFVSAPATDGLLTWFTSRGDDLTANPLASGRGLGQQIVVSYDANDVVLDKSVDWQFIEPVEVHDGQVSWSPVDEWSHDDLFSFSVIIEGNDALASSTPGTGNVNPYDPGDGSTIYLPAAGDGSHTIDLALARPVKVEGQGLWDVDHLTGVITPNPDGAGDWHLVGHDIEAFFINEVSMGHPGGWFDVDVYKTDWVHQNWKLRLRVKRAASPTVATKVGAWAYTFRGANTRL